VVNSLKNIEYVKVESEDTEGTAFTEEFVIRLVSDGKRNQALIIPEDFSEKVLAGEIVNLPFYLDPALPVQYRGPVRGSIVGALYSVVFAEQMKQDIPKRINEGMDKFEKNLGIVIPANVRQEILKSDFMQNYLFPGSQAQDEGFSFDEDALVARLDKRQPPEIKREEFPSVYQQNLSGYSVLAIFFIITAIGAGFFDEKKFGTFRRILAMPLGKASFLVGKLIPYVIINLLQVGLLVFLSVVFYGCDLGEHPEALVLVTICSSLAAAGIALALVTLFKSYTKMSSVSVIVVLISTALSGAFVPRFVMGELVQKISLIVPQSWSLIAYQNVMVRGKDIMGVLPECGVLLLFSMVFFAFGLWRFSYSES
jgi:ABC-2 type transport system permease protein